jgi:transposase
LIYDRLLSFGSDWQIDDVKVNEKIKEIDIFLKYSRSTYFLDDSEPDCLIYDYTATRRIRHLDLFDYKTFVNFRTPRGKTYKGNVVKIPVPFADSRVSFSYLFEVKVIKTLELSKNQTATAKYLNTTFEIIHHIMERAVNRGLNKRNLEDLTDISLDEKSVFDGHNYITILSDPIQKRVIDIIMGRKKEDVEELFYSTLSAKQRSKIRNVTMDMWQSFMSCVQDLIPQASIVHDNFHIMKYLNKGVDETRKQEVKTNQELKKTIYVFLKNPSKLTDNQQKLFEEINAINLKTSQTWAMKENSKQIYNYWKKKECINYFKKWYTNVIESQIKPMITVADTILNHIEGVINAAVTTMSNSIAENINGKIQIIKAVARGYKNIKGYRNAILFFNGNLELLPL